MKNALALSIGAGVAQLTIALIAVAQDLNMVSGIAVNPLREAYYGDLHLHTSYSFDAYLMGTTSVDPDEAYRFAKGEVVNYLGQPVQRREPLDFLAVTDHAENIGVFNELEDPGSAVSQSELGKTLKVLLTPMTRSDGRRDSNLAPKDAGWLDQFAAFYRDYFSGAQRRIALPHPRASESEWLHNVSRKLT